MNLTTALHTTPFEAALGLIGARANGESDGRSAEGPRGSGAARVADLGPGGRRGDENEAPLYVRQAEVRAMRREKRATPGTGAPREVLAVDFVASTETKDSYDSIIKSTWDLKRFNANPVLLWMHGRQNDLPAVGTIEGLRKEGTSHVGTAVFDDTTEFDRDVAAKYEKGVLKGFSIGFYPHTVRFETHDDVEVLILDDIELLEISCVNVPSNPEALAKARAALRTRALGATTPSAPPVPATPPTSAAPPRAPKDQTMKTLKLDVRAHRAANGTTAACPACNEAMAVQIDNLPEDNERAVADLTTRAAAAETKAAEADARAALVTNEKDAAEKRAASLEARTASAEAALKVYRDATIAAEIDKRIGTRMEPAERADEVEIAERLLADTTPDPDKPGHTLGEKKWAARLAKIDARRDLGLLGPAITGGGEQGVQNSGAAPSQARSVVDEINARAAG